MPTNPDEILIDSINGESLGTRREFDALVARVRSALPQYICSGCKQPIGWDGKDGRDWGYMHYVKPEDTCGQAIMMVLN